LSRNEEISLLQIKLDQLENLSYNELKEENAMLRNILHTFHTIRQILFHLDDVLYRGSSGYLFKKSVTALYDH